MDRKPLVQDIQSFAQNIVDTVREPLLIMDAELRVRSANRAFYQAFHVTPEETEDRLIYELGNGQWDIPALRTLLEDIVPASSVFNDFELEHDFPSIGRKVMLLNARKLRDGDHLEFLVLAMEDVTERRRAERLVAEIETYAQNVVDTVREPLLIMDTRLRVRSANRAFYQAFQVTPEETEDRLIYELGNGQWDIPALRTLLEDIVPANGVFNDFELEHDFPSIGRKVMLLNARKLRQGDHSDLLVLAMEDVTERRRAERLVAEIETYAQNVVDTVREPLLIMDARLRIRSANRAFYQAFHVTPEETENQLIYQLGNGQWDIPALRTLLEDIVPASSVFNDFELEHDFPSIGRKVMLLNARKLRQGDHSDLLVLAMEDVTERRRAEGLLADIATYTQNILDTVREPLLIMDAKLRIRSANRAFYENFHVSPEETENRLIYDLGNGQWDIPVLRTLLEDIVPQGSVFNEYELEHDFPVIGPRVMLLDARLLRQVDRSEFLVLAIKDITVRRKAERLLAEIETYAQNIVDTVREPLLMLDPTLRVRSANRAFYRTFQVSPEDTENQLIYELGNGQWDIPALRTLLEEIIPQNKVFNDYELTHDFPSIGRRAMLLNARELRAGNHTEMLVLALEDVTERNRVHDLELRFTAELQESFHRLQELETLRDNLTNMIIHDLRTPLTSVIAGMQTLELLGEMNPDQMEMMELAVNGGETLLGMINDLLDVEKLESGSMQLDYVSLSVMALVASATRQVASLIVDKQLGLIQKIEPGLLHLQGDEGKLCRTLVNLLGNAIKFTPPGGTITLNVTQGPSDPVAVFSVTDTGEGIPPEAFERIFEKFGQVESRRGGRTMSTGLGLTFCKLAVEAHGGVIGVESPPGRGSTFRFTIPIAGALPAVGA